MNFEHIDYYGSDDFVNEDTAGVDMLEWVLEEWVQDNDLWFRILDAT
jgi:hypothetical protein